jgi:IclR family mhp operon transcriptional activator
MQFNRSLGRGLRILAILNSGGEHRVASIARAVGLPRSTAFRILCTLVDDGYVWRDPVTDVYHPTAMVLALSAGFDATSRLVESARPVVEDVGKQLIWPVSLATVSGTSVVLRQTTHATSPLALVKYTAGFRAPILDGASGLVLLAFSDRAQRQMILDLLYRSDAESLPTIARAEIERQIAEVRRLGFAVVHRSGQSSDRSGLAVPVRADGDALAALVVRFAHSAVNQRVMMDRFLPALRRAARCIVDRLNAAPPQTAHSEAVPAARYAMEIDP